MKKINLIMAIIIASLLSSCGNDDQDRNKNTQNNSDATNINSEQTDTLPGISYMTFSSKKNTGSNISIILQYPKGEEVWIDWNENQNLDEGEKLDTTEHIQQPNGNYDEYQTAEINKLKNTNFVIYGNVTHLKCPYSKITAINVSHNPNLEELFCSNNDIKNLDISKNKNLKILYCDNTPLTELDISNNTELSELSVPRSLETKVFNFTPEIRNISKQLEQQNLIPKGYHVLKSAKNINNDDAEEKNDKLILFEEDIPYAKRKNVYVKTKLIYFQNLGNDEYKNIGVKDRAFFDFIKFKNKNYILKGYIMKGGIASYDFYKIKKGKIVKTKAFAINSVKPNQQGIYEVRNANELLGSIGSNRRIKIMSKSINLTDIKSDFDFLNKYYTDCDGSINGILFSDMENLTITGGVNEKTKLLLKENYIVIFSNAENIKLQNLQIAHTPEANKYNGEVAFVDCKKVTLDGILLYKCGEQGIKACDVDELNCKNIIIEQCMVNALDLNKCKNSVFENFEFRHNTLNGSLIQTTNCQNITFKNGKIRNNDVGDNLIVETTNACKSIIFENVEMKNNKSKDNTDNTHKSFVKFAK